jgi:hypothetical protein
LLTLLALLDTEDLPMASSYKPIVEVRNTYLKLFQRKMYAATCSYIDYANFRMTMNKVKLLTSLIETYIMQECSGCN